MAEGEVVMEGNVEPARGVFIGVHLPLSLLFWHAPALVHWLGLTPAKSLFFSIVACLRNFWAFVVFGVTWIAVLMLLVVAVTLIATLAGSAELASSLMLPALMVMVSMFFTSLYFSFRDSFEAPTEEVEATSAELPR